MATSCTLAKRLLTALVVLGLPLAAEAGVPTIFGGTVFNDLDQDGSLDPGEPGLNGVTVNLDFGADGTTDQQQLTSGAGGYGFTASTPGTYRVRIEPSPGLVQTTPNPADFVVTIGGNFTVNFGLGPVPNVLAIPTLGTWGAIGFMAALLSAAWIALRRAPYRRR